MPLQPSMFCRFFVPMPTLHAIFLAERNHPEYELELDKVLSQERVLQIDYR
jgi:hypothetical protein